ncbi:MerR family transcriptional regulator [Paraburkholderia tropica]|uniref:MerR family transcriptional regulator n=1 Tax=Paraburkholderia tropica TaxID=92647 RepID=UPI0032B32666
MSKEESTKRRYRSGEAAKLARMPAATLRIWEQRYGVISPPTSASGQRLYSDEDVNRLRHVKALVDRGYAIGSVARLEKTALEALLSSKTRQKAAPKTEAGDEAVTFVAVGFGDVDVDECITASFESIEALLQSNSPLRASGLIAHISSLHPQTVDRLAEGAVRIGANEVMVVFPFGTEDAIQLATLQGMTLRKRADALLRAGEFFEEFTTLLRERAIDESSDRNLWRRSSRRFDNSTLARLARLSSAIACECPRHLAELIMQLSAFENYSDECISRSPADAMLHRHLGDAANRAARLLEESLSEVARKEGWDVLNPPQLSS